MQHLYSEDYRWEKYYKLPLVYRFFARIPFGIYNAIMNSLEYNFGNTCPICNRSYCILTQKGREKLKNCCAETKKNRFYGGGSFSSYGEAERRYDGSEVYYHDGAHSYYRRD